MSKIVLALLFLFLVYEVILKDNFGIRKVVRNHFESLERGIYSILVTLVFPIASYILNRASIMPGRIENRADYTLIRIKLLP